MLAELVFVRSIVTSCITREKAEAREEVKGLDKWDA